MNIVMFGPAQDIAEGASTVARGLANALSKRHSLSYHSMPKSYGNLQASVQVLRSWISRPREVPASRPDIVHLIPPNGPTVPALAIYGVLTSTLKPSMGVISVLQTRQRVKLDGILRSRRQKDVALVQTDQSETTFRALGYRVAVFPNGVNPGQFSPTSREERASIRVSLGIPPDELVILHVGQVTHKRGVLDLLSVVKHDATLMVVAGARSDPSLIDKLMSHKGVHVVEHYVTYLRSIYAAADCYVFPTREPLGSLDMPLSVLEALACGLPVVSTKYGALPRFLGSSPMVHFCDSVRDLPDLVLRVAAEPRQPSSEFAIAHSWDRLALDLERIYQEGATQCS